MTTPLEDQEVTIKDLLRREGIAETEIESGTFDLSFLMLLARGRREERARAQARIPDWIAAGLMTEEQASRMTPEEIDRFYSRQAALDSFRETVRPHLPPRSSNRDELVGFLRDTIAAVEALESKGARAATLIQDLKRRASRW